MNFANVIDWVIPQGNVIKVVDSQNRTIWQKISPEYAVPFYVENITNSTETMFIGKTQNNAPTLTIEYSLDKSTWSTLGNTSRDNRLTWSLNPGDKLYLRCLTNGVWGMGANDYNYIRGVSKVGGNIMSLLYGSNFNGAEDSFPSSTNWQFSYIFANNTTLLSAADLLLPVKNLTGYCYNGMFNACTSLTAAPNLPSTNLANGCYENMFGFCSSLVTAPDLPATTLYQGCYANMFDNCVRLRNVSILPALNLTTQCYWRMFNQCVSLNNIKCLATNGTIVNTPADNVDPTYQWTNGVASTGIFYKSAGISWHSGIDGIPSGWTVIEV